MTRCCWERHIRLREALIKADFNLSNFSKPLKTAPFVERFLLTLSKKVNIIYTNKKRVSPKEENYMEKLIVEKIGFIKETTYQRIKKEMNKKDDYFYKNELIPGENVIKISQIFPKLV